jgi:hypothetical protein
MHGNRIYDVLTGGQKGEMDRDAWDGGCGARTATAGLHATGSLREA